MKSMKILLVCIALVSLFGFSSATQAEKPAVVRLTRSGYFVASDDPFDEFYEVGARLPNQEQLEAAEPTIRAQPASLTFSRVEESSPSITSPGTELPEEIIQKNHDQIEDLLETNEEVRVIVHLESPLPLTAPIQARMQDVSELQDELLNKLTAEDFTLIRKFSLTSGFSGYVTQTGLDKLLRLPEVITVYEDLPVYAALSESLPMINADDVHNMGYTGEGVSVAVLDTGIDTDHPDLSDDLIAEHCFTDNACPPGNSNESTSAEDGNGHGTSVSGIISSRGTVAPLGVAPDAGIVAVKILDDNGGGWFSDVVSGIDWVVVNHNAHGTVAINLSLSGGLYTGECDTTYPDLADAIDSARANNITVFAASGNGASSSRMGAPACLSNAISVGAVYDANVGGITWCLNSSCTSTCTDSSTSADMVTCFTNSNSLLDIMAPSYQNLTTDIGGGTNDSFSGTSAASPHAAATAALMYDVVPGIDPSIVESRLEDTGVMVTDPKNGLSFPRIDAYAAVTVSDFSKTAPSDDAADVSISPTLSWETSSGATSYEYCIDTTDDSACDGDAWQDNGTGTSVGLSGLAGGETYYWQVRALSTSVTTYANDDVWWSFTTEASILGDVNDDDLVNSTDALIVLSCDAGMDTSSFCPMNCGDVNNDGVINSTDALIILSYDAGMDVPYPVGESGCPSSVTPCGGCSP